MISLTWFEGSIHLQVKHIIHALFLYCSFLNSHSSFSKLVHYHSGIFSPAWGHLASADVLQWRGYQWWQLCYWWFQTLTRHSVSPVTDRLKPFLSLTRNGAGLPASLAFFFQPLFLCFQVPLCLLWGETQSNWYRSGFEMCKCTLWKAHLAQWNNRHVFAAKKKNNKILQENKQGASCQHSLKWKRHCCSEYSTNDIHTSLNSFGGLLYFTQGQTLLNFTQIQILHGTLKGCVRRFIYRLFFVNVM